MSAINRLRAMISSNRAVSEALSKRFASDKGLYGTIDDIPLIAQKGHYRRMAILDALPIGEVSDKVCVDFGTGSWGFAGIYPRLHGCRFAYGLDISKVALEQSHALSKANDFPYGDKVEYLQSDGLDIPLPDKTADIIFAGEAIEHVRLPQRFLSECHRLLRVGGQLIITTPNRDALLYKIQSDQYCVGPEHFWLFNLDELKSAVSEFFGVEECVGFNGSIYREIDRKATDHQATEEWAKLFLDKPEFSTGLILRAVKDSDQTPKRYAIRPIPYESLSVAGPRQVLDLEFGLKGTMIDSSASSIRFMCPASSGLVMYFWTHSWSGIASIRWGSKTTEYNLWSQDPGWKPVRCTFDVCSSYLVEIRATERKDARALNHQVIFFEAFVYDD